MMETLRKSYDPSVRQIRFMVLSEKVGQHRCMFYIPYDVIQEKLFFVCVCVCVWSELQISKHYIFVA